MTRFGPLAVYFNDDRVYVLNPLRFAEEQPLPPADEIQTMCRYYRTQLLPLAPGVVHGSSHELAAWLLTSSAQLISQNRTDDAIEALNEADKLLVEGQQFTDDSLWRAAVFYNLAVCMDREPPGRDFQETIYQVRTARELLWQVNPEDVNQLSLSNLERAVSASEEMVAIRQG